MLLTTNRLASSLLLTLFFLVDAFAQHGNDQLTSSAALQVNSNPQGAVIELTGKYTFVGRTPFLVPYQLFGKYKVHASKDGYESKTASVRLVNKGFNSVTINLSKKTRAKAALRSVLFPGWGQFYGQNKTRGFWVSTVQLAFGVVSIYAINDYNNEKNDYDVALRNFNRNQLNEEDAQRAFDEVQKQFNQADDAQNFRDATLYLTAGFWLYNVLDSIFFFSAGNSSLKITAGRTSAISGVKPGDQLKLTMQVRL